MFFSVLSRRARDKNPVTCGQLAREKAREDAFRAGRHACERRDRVAAVTAPAAAVAALSARLVTGPCLDGEIA